MNFKLIPIQPPSAKEKIALRLMILVGVAFLVFFLCILFQKDIIGSYPLYVLLMVTMVYYCCKYLHEWYHYFSISAPDKPIANKVYTVDILTTYCAGEPFDMLEQTLIAIQNITYPHDAWCCDEADDPMVKQLCLRLGVRHVTRTCKKDAKAGNINNALQYATGELCVVLDPDHVPAPEFLDELVAYFDDPLVGFVQIVQGYYNQHQTIVAKGAAQQTYQFYGPMMMAMHSYGTVQAIGANCTFRRTSLDSIGGHASGLCEDMHTAMRLHAGGWRSVYVPAILTRGLVPSTMSSYYKQQLKWSRGTWDLLVHTYPKLFTKFTLRQKLHYFTLPFHYLSGIIFFINFLIPVISLCTGDIPLQMDVIKFLLVAFPVFSMAILIRHYVQKWVAEEKERGFHLVGGILQIGAWWIYTLGFIYTILRKKVPYMPTPKNDNEALPFLMNLPNILVALISLIAIVYGLWHDYNPYTIFMVVLAAMQILFMVFILSISGHISDKSKVNAIAMQLRQKTWLIIKTHGFLRSYSLPLSFLVITLFVLGYWKQEQLPSFLPKPLSGLQVFYQGLYQQRSDAATGTGNPIFSIIDQRKDIAIISCDVPWGPGEKNQLDTAYLRQVYGRHAIPLLVCKLWQKDSASNAAKDTAVMQHIIAGKYDGLFLPLATQVAHLHKPVYLRFSNEPHQNKYPLFASDNCKPDEFIAAWQYVHRLFDQAGADKVIWIWNPGDTARVNDYFPGESYVDWLGVNIVDTNKGRLQTNIHSFDTLYRPYHLLRLFKSGLPVMVTETVGYAPNEAQWWNAAWKAIDTAFTEIRSVIVGPPDYSVNKKVVAVVTPLSVKTFLVNAPKPNMPLDMDEMDLPKFPAKAAQHRLPAAIKSIVYDKGYHWFRNRHTLGLKTIEADVEAMKKIGINTIERTMPGVYDHNLGKELVLNGMNLIPRFWLSASPEVIANDRKMMQQKEKILGVIKNNLDKKYIIAWNLGDDVLHSLASQNYEPDYFYYRQKYVVWLSDLCRQIRLLDSVRPIIMDLHWDVNGPKQFHYYKIHVPQIDTYMLLADAKYTAGLKEPLEEGMAWGKVEVELWPLVPSIRQSGTIPAWQDIENTDYISMNGLLDLEGRKKQWYRVVLNTWGNRPTAPSPIPDIKILRSAMVTRENNRLVYSVIYKKDDFHWQVYNDEVQGVLFEWYLVRTDQYGNTIFIKQAGNSPSLELSIPREPQYYKLYVEAIMGDDIKMVNTTLNTPLE
jgi:cellulose synthase (UDP-forming)